VTKRIHRESLCKAKKKDLGPVDRGHPESESCRAAGSALRVYLKSFAWNFV
jgi:hypothetical protein